MARARLQAKRGPSTVCGYEPAVTPFCGVNADQEDLRGIRFVQDSDRRLDFGHRDLMLLDLLIKRAARNTESLRGLLNAASLFLKHAFDVLLFELDQCQA